MTGDRILIVDDQPAVRDVLAAMLELAGYQVRSASHGREALDLIEQQPIDMVLLDVNMPGMDGWTVLGKLRARAPQLPVIVISDERHAAEARDLGVAGFISKPYRRAELEHVIGEALGASVSPPCNGPPASGCTDQHGTP